MSTDERESTLRRWLDAGAGFDAEYGAELSNHLPMALFALHRLGADAARLQAFAGAASRKLSPAPAALAWPAGDAWTSRLGERAAFAAYRDLFAQWLEHEPPEQVLAIVLPRLMAGCAAAAFHGLIRTAYALQSAQHNEVVDGLAYWACRWQPLGQQDDAASEPTSGHTDPALALLRVPVPHAAPRGRLISQRIAAVAAQPGFAAAVSALRVDKSTLQRLAEGSAELYAQSGNFTVLHMLTSAHALRVLLPWLEEPLPALRHYWCAWAAAWAASAARPDATAAQRPWPEIVAAAVASDDEHVVKGVDSCREQQAVYGGRVWQRAASRMVASA